MIPAATTGRQQIPSIPHTPPVRYAAATMIKGCIVLIVLILEIVGFGLIQMRFYYIPVISEYIISELTEPALSSLAYPEIE